MLLLLKKDAHAHASWLWELGKLYSCDQDRSATRPSTQPGRGTLKAHLRRPLVISLTGTSHIP